jgi:uncharacterized protein (DUF934 family)
MRVKLATGREPEVISDGWIDIADAAAVPPGAEVVVSFARLLREADAIFAVAAGVGVEVVGADKVEDLIPWITRLGIVVLRFGFFKDGRLFTAARLLRQRLQFGGEIRAAGDILPDQALFLLRSGVNSLDVADTFHLESAARTIRAYSVRYQQAVDELPVASEQRAEAAAE